EALRSAMTLTLPIAETSGARGRSGWLMRFVLSVLAAALVAPASALGASAFYVRGHGYGHGIGMSQYGAYGLAQHGADAATILGHYYTGTALSTVSPTQPVKVL